MADQLEETEKYLKDAEQNIESVGKFFGGLIFKVFYFIAGGLEYLVKPFLPKDDREEEPF